MATTTWSRLCGCFLSNWRKDELIISSLSQSSTFKPAALTESSSPHITPDATNSQRQLVTQLSDRALALAYPCAGESVAQPTSSKSNTPNPAISSTFATNNAIPPTASRKRLSTASCCTESPFATRPCPSVVRFATPTSTDGAWRDSEGHLLNGDLSDGKSSRLRLAPSVTATTTGPAEGGGAQHSGTLSASGSTNGEVQVGNSGTGASQLRRKLTKEHSRSLTILASRLIAHDVDYSTEIRALLTQSAAATEVAARNGDTDGTGASRLCLRGTFPASRLRDLLQRHAIHMPSGTLTALLRSYRAAAAEDGGGGGGEGAEGRTEGAPDDAGGKEGEEFMVDGAALLKDLERAAFRRLTLTKPVGSGAGRKDALSSCPLDDRSSIVAKVTARVQTEMERSGSAFPTSLNREDIAEVVESIDLTRVALPVGTQAKYIPATNERGAFLVPVWSLRAMQARKQARHHKLLSSDPDLQELGQAGREALRQRLSRRSILQQQNIIASAVATAACIALAPSSARNTPHSLRSGADISPVASIPAKQPHTWAVPRGSTGDGDSGSNNVEGAISGKAATGAVCGVEVTNDSAVTVAGAASGGGGAALPPQLQNMSNSEITRTGAVGGVMVQSVGGMMSRGRDADGTRQQQQQQEQGQEMVMSQPGKGVAVADRHGNSIGPNLGGVTGNTPYLADTARLTQGVKACDADQKVLAECGNGGTLLEAGGDPLKCIPSEHVVATAPLHMPTLERCGSLLPGQCLTPVLGRTSDVASTSGPRHNNQSGTGNNYKLAGETQTWDNGQTCP